MDCVHHWKIETPNGAGSVGGGSTGSCIHCGESRQFRNSLPEWDKYRGRARGTGELSPQEKKLAKGTVISDATKVGAAFPRQAVPWSYPLEPGFWQFCCRFQNCQKRIAL